MDAVYDEGHTQGYTEGYTMGTRRVDLKEAAVELGITSEAVRRRAKRGTLPSEIGEDGRLYVWLPDVYDAEPHAVSDNGRHATDDHPLSEVLLERFEDENTFLRRELERLHKELERKDAILLTMAQRIPELEAVPEPRVRSETTPEDKDGDRAQDDTERPSSWWKWLFSASQP